MKLIIEVTEDYYAYLKGKVDNSKASVSDITILNGKPYEERPQGDLISRSELRKRFQAILDRGDMFCEYDIIGMVDNAPPVESYKEKYDMAIEAIHDIKEKVWEIDIPSPTIPEYIEHHEQVKSVLIVIYNWLTKLEEVDNGT